MAQIPDDDEGPRVTIGYRGGTDQLADLRRVLDEEMRAPNRRGRRTLSRVCEFTMGLGLDLYWALHETGTQLDALAADSGWTRRQALRECLRRGLQAERREKKR